LLRGAAYKHAVFYPSITRAAETVIARVTCTWWAVRVSPLGQPVIDCHTERERETHLPAEPPGS